RVVLAVSPDVLESDGTSKIFLHLDVSLNELEMQRAQEACWLAQDRDDSRIWLHLGDTPCSRGRPQVEHRSLAGALIGSCWLEQRQVLVQASIAHVAITLLW